MGELIKTPDLTAAQLTTIRHTIAKDANDVEFNLFMEMAKQWGLDPFKKHMHIIVYNKDKPDKRTNAIFPSRDGFRIMAARQNDYRPAEGPADFEYSEAAKDKQRNPLGIVRCGITLQKQDPVTREWHPVYGEAYWDEFAKAKEKWDWNQEKGKRAPTGEWELSGGWATMPRLMIQKCAEGQALRAGWPDVFGGMMTEEEVRMPNERHMKDVTPDSELSASDRVAKQRAHERANLLGKPAVMLVFTDGGVLERVEMGDVFDRCAEHIGLLDPEALFRWREQNEVSLREYWADQPTDALELKKLIEAKLGDYNPAGAA